MPNVLSHMRRSKLNGEQNSHVFHLSEAPHTEDPLDEWEKRPDRICVWHQIVDGILVERVVKTTVRDDSPNFYFVDNSRQGCVIARIYDTEFLEDENFLSLGDENKNSDAREHIFILKEGNEVESDPDTSGRKLVQKGDNYNQNVIYGIYGTEYSNKVRFAYRLGEDAQGNKYSTKESWIPIWYFYEQGELKEVSLDYSPIVDWQIAREIYNDEVAKNSSTKEIFEKLQAAKCYVFVRLYKNDPNNEGDIGQSKGGQPPPG